MARDEVLEATTRARSTDPAIGVRHPRGAAFFAGFPLSRTGTVRPVLAALLMDPVGPGHHTLPRRGLATRRSSGTTGLMSSSVIVEIRAAEGGSDAKLLVEEQAAIYLKVGARREL